MIYLVSLILISGVSCLLEPFRSRPIGVQVWSQTTAFEKEIYRELSIEHAEEVSRGFRTFGRSKSEPNKWMGEDFNVIELPPNSAGPTETTLKRGSDIFITTEPVISFDDCKDLIKDASVAIAQGMAADDANSELNEAKLSDLPTKKGLISKLVHEKLFPMLEYCYGVDATSLTLNDGLILRYVGPSRSQPIHRDASLLTLQVALSPSADFTAGGTYFEAIKDTVVMEAGHALCHSSGIMHAGKAIDSGDRWVMVFFVLSDEEIQVAKRCHAAGVSKMDEGDHTLAESYFRSGLEASPTDHLLHNSLANCYFVQGENAKGREQLRLAQSYKPCSKALLLHANTLMMLSRPRAALRRLEQALNDIDGSDTLPGAWTPLKALAWECRVQAGRAACLCAEKERESAGPGDNLKWSKTQLPAAMQRMRIALTAAPEHGPLRGMLARAEELYTMANASSAE